MTDDEPDPEVLADLALRKASERDSSRTRTARYDWTPPIIIGQWRCRNKECPAWVPISVDAMEAAMVFNGELRRRGEAPLDFNAIVVCSVCREKTRPYRADKLRERTEKTRCLILELKKGVKPDREREILDQLKAWHHPDLAGLENWLRDRNKASDGKRRRDL